MSADDKPTKPDDEAFLSRWSRRKVEAREETEPELPAETPTEPEEAEVDIEALEAIDIEKLDYSADFSVFMKKGVPDALRQRALRQLWRSNPVLANVDGLNDYDENFRVAHTILEKFASAYTIGKGHLTDAEWAKSRGELPPEEDEAETESADADTQDEDDDLGGEGEGLA